MARKAYAERNYLLLQIQIEDIILLLDNSYGPNTDNSSFKKHQEVLQEFDDNNVICGNFNLVLNLNLNYFYHNPNNNPSAR